MRACCFGWWQSLKHTFQPLPAVSSPPLPFLFVLWPAVVSQPADVMPPQDLLCLQRAVLLGDFQNLLQNQKRYRSRINDASLIELGSLMVVRQYRPADGSGLVAGASGSILGGSTSSLLAPFPSGVTLGLSDVTLLGLRLPGDKDGLLGDRGIDAGGGGDLDFLGLCVFWGGLVVEPLTNRQQHINRWTKSSL